METEPIQPSPEHFWQQYENACKLHEFYWSIVLKTAAYFYTLTGALGAFYIANRSMSTLSWLLLIPIYLGVTLAILYGIASFWSSYFQNWFDDLSSQDRLRMNYRLETLPLTLFY